MAPSSEPRLPIVVIDDEENILLAIDTTLRLAGFDHVFTCQDSRQAMDVLQGRQASVVLLDLNMPHLDGEDLLARISLEFPHIPIIIVTGTLDVDTAVRCIRRIRPFAIICLRTVWNTPNTSKPSSPTAPRC